MDFNKTCENRSHIVRRRSSSINRYHYFWLCLLKTTVYPLLLKIIQREYENRRVASTISNYNEEFVGCGFPSALHFYAICPQREKSSSEKIIGCPAFRQPQNHQLHKKPCEIFNGSCDSTALKRKRSVKKGH